MYNDPEQNIRSVDKFPGVPDTHMFLLMYRSFCLRPKSINFSSADLTKYREEILKSFDLFTVNDLDRVQLEVIQGLPLDRNGNVVALSQDENEIDSFLFGKKMNPININSISINYSPDESIPPEKDLLFGESVPISDDRNLGPWH